MEEAEVPTEQLHETLQEKAHETHGGDHHGASWIAAAALSSALLAVLAAVSALLSGHHANEAMVDQMQATDTWAYYQAKGIKASVLRTKDETLVALGKEAPAEDEQHVAKYEAEQTEIERQAREKESSSAEHLRHHNALARVVTLYQVGIAIAAIAVISRKRALWFFSLLMGLVASVLFVLGAV
jgi:hypothetical protein